MIRRLLFNLDGYLWCLWRENGIQSVPFQIRSSVGLYGTLVVQFFKSKIKDLMENYNSTIK